MCVIQGTSVLMACPARASVKSSQIFALMMASVTSFQVKELSAGVYQCVTTLCICVLYVFRSLRYAGA